MLIGWDGAPPQILEAMVKKGLLKNFARLMKNGTFINAMNPYPTITASNWTTLSTGAWPGRHGVTCYFVHHPGEPLDKIYSGFDTRECSVEHIWDAAERAGKKSILVHYETSWPSTLKDGIVVGGCGPNYQDDFHKITPDIVFSTESYPWVLVTSQVTVENTTNGFRAPLKFKTDAGEEKEYIAVWDSDSTIVSIYSDASMSNHLATVEVGSWSEPAYDDFLLKDEKIKGAFRFKLISLPSKDNEEFMLLCTSIVPVSGYTCPIELGPDLTEKLGPYIPRGGWEVGAIIGPEHYLDYLNKHHKWLTDACKHLMEKEDWGLLYTQTHAQDYVNHMFMRNYDPMTAAPDKLKECEDYMERAYESADEMLGQLLEYADDETLVAVVSDHGATTWVTNVNVSQILIDKGLMVVDPDTRQVVWEKTRAVPQRSCHVYVNLKGRDPHGIVEPGEEYEAVREEIVEAFYDYVEPETGKRPFTMVLTREDARTIGLYGERVGDIIYAVHPRYGHEHGQNLSTGRLGRGSQESVILLSGPGIKKDFVHCGMTGIQDVVPTLCYMADIPFPKGCEGAIIYDALENPGFKAEKITKLERDLKRLKEAYERQVSITHNPF